MEGSDVKAAKPKYSAQDMLEVLTRMIAEYEEKVAAVTAIADASKPLDPYTFARQSGVRGNLATLIALWESFTGKEWPNK